MLLLTLADNAPGIKAGYELKNLANADKDFFLFLFFEFVFWFLVFFLEIEHKIWCQKSGGPMKSLTQREQDKNLFNP